MSLSVMSAPRYQPSRMPRPVYTAPETVRLIDTTSKLDTLLDELRDRSRRRPAIVTSPNGSAPVVRLGAVADAVGDSVLLAELTNATAAQWQARWPDNCAWGGATRMFGPRRVLNNRENSCLAIT